MAQRTRVQTFPRGIASGGGNSRKVPTFCSIILSYHLSGYAIFPSYKDHSFLRRCDRKVFVSVLSITSVNMRISQLSSNQEVFSKTAPLYEAALRRSNYQADLKYSPNNSNKTRTRSRNIIWFNPPYSTNVRTNVGRNFLSLVDKHFPSSNPLHKIFNRNSVKVSYSCMNNCKSVISKHNIGILPKVRQLQHQQRTAMITVTAETPTIVHSKRIA